MLNYFDLSVGSLLPNLGEGIRILRVKRANRFNRNRGRTGRTYQRCYKALHVELGRALAHVAHYIHLNPARAKILPVKQLVEFRWSSFRWLLRKDRPRWLVADTVLTEAGNLVDSPAGWRRYRDYLAVLAKLSPREWEAKFGRLSEGWAVGTKEFRQGLIRDLREQEDELTQASRLGERAGVRQAFREEIWAERLEAAAGAAGVDLRNLGPRKSAPEKVLLAAVMKATSDVSNRWLSERLQMGTPASASQFVRRFHLGGGGDNVRYRRALEQTKGAAAQPSPP